MFMLLETLVQYICASGSLYYAVSCIE